MAEWREKGVKFTFGSDLHKGGYPLSGESSFSECEKIPEEYGFTDDDFAQPF